MKEGYITKLPIFLCRFSVSSCLTRCQQAIFHSAVKILKNADSKYVGLGLRYLKIFQVNLFGQQVENGVETSGKLCGHLHY